MTRLLWFLAVLCGAGFWAVFLSGKEIGPHSRSSAAVMQVGLGAPRVGVQQPDCRQLAFTRMLRTRLGSRVEQIFVLGEDSETAVQLTGERGDGGNSYPCYSPAGDMICFVSDREGRDHIYVMNSDGSHQRRLTGSFATCEYCPDWCPNPEVNLIAYAQGQWDYLTSVDLYVTDLRGRTERLTGDGAWDQHPSWSPDGRFVAFCRRDPSGSECNGIYVVRVGDRKVWGLGVRGRYPDWSPAGDRVLYAYDGRVYCVPVDIETGRRAGEPTETAGSDGDWPRRPRWSPDGRSVLYESLGQMVLCDISTGESETVCEGKWGDWWEPVARGGRIVERQSGAERGRD